MIVGNMVGCVSRMPHTVVLVDDNGTEYPAVLTDEDVVLTATENDIRVGSLAVTEKGFTEGSKVIPTYHTSEGCKLITAGSAFQTVSLPTLDLYDFTKLQIIICPWEGSIDESVSAEKVVIGESVYDVNSSTAISSVTRDNINKLIDLGITNDSDSSYLLRYFTYKEIE